MKALFVEGYPGFRGAQRSLAALAAGLPESVEVEILCTVAGRSVEGYRRSGLPVRLFEVPPVLATFGGGLARCGVLGRLDAGLRGLLPFTVRLWRRLRRERPDVVHCNQARAVLLVAPAARLLGIPVIWHLRGTLDFGGFLERVTGALSTRVVCVSQAVQDSTATALRRKCTVVHNGISPAAACGEIDEVRGRFESVLRERGLESAALRLVTASSFLPYKGLHHLVDAFANLVERRPELRRRLLWAVLGAAEGYPRRERYRRELKRRLRDRGLGDNVFWPGWRDRAVAWIAACDVAVLPTVERETFRFDDGVEVEAVSTEGFPRTVLEAMAAGTAVVASGVAGVEEQIVDGVSGLVVTPGSAEALGSAIERLVDDRELRSRLAAGARERVARFSVEAMVAATRAVYKELVLASQREDPPRRLV